MGGISVYVHIPFCEQKCNYCDFNSFAGKEDFFEAYIGSLIQEIGCCTELSNMQIDTVFIGGGTPSVLPPYYIGKIMEALGQFNISKTAEITIEANPNSLTKEKLSTYRKSGINRLSIGLQAIQDNLLKKLGRLHSASDFLNCYENALRAGFENISADLIFAVPGQTLSNWEESLKTLINLGLKHISCYSLIIEEGTLFYNEYEKGSLISVDDDLDRQMYYMAADILGSNNFKQYETSNFAQKGFESLHNIAYWTRKDYIGCGLSAHSLFNNKRFENTADLDKYIESSGKPHSIRQNIIQLSLKEQMEEFMFLGLRMTDGISLDDFKNNFDTDIMTVYGDTLNKHINDNFLFFDKNIIKLTKKGADLSNVVFSDFLLD